MYHIPENKRSYLSARLITDAMKELLQEKPFEKITIVDIQKKSQIGRNTFYRLFDRTEDVLLYLYDQEFQHELELYKKLDAKERMPLLKFFLTEIKRNDFLLDALIQTSQIDILQEVYKDNHELLAEVSPLKVELTPLEEDYLIGWLISSVFGIVKVWIAHDKKETPDELYEILKKQIILNYELL